MVAGERDGAPFPRHGERPLRVGSSPEHVSQRPELLCATSVGRREDGIERVTVRVRVRENGYAHVREGERAARGMRRRVTSGVRDPVIIGDACVS